jgi:hypothetical protein
MTADQVQGQNLYLVGSLVIDLTNDIMKYRNESWLFFYLCIMNRSCKRQDNKRPAFLALT